MRKIYVLLFAFFCCKNVFAQSFADPNFTTTTLGSGWVSAVGARFSPDGQKLFVWERAGKLYVCNRDGSGNYIKQVTPVADITQEVADWDAHGFLGFAVDPNFQTNGLIYLMYVVNRHHLLYYGTPDYNPNITITGQATIGRVTRYQTTTSGGNLVINPASRYVLIGESKTTGMPILHHSHGVGTLAFARDGTLLVTIGDAASYEGNDAGSDPGTFYAQALADGIIRPAENVGAFRSQLVNSMSGKLLRIDPQTGNGVSSNPFYDAAQPRAPKSRVWALGIRNSFRIFIKPESGSTDPAVGDIGEVFLGDVGFASWEEMNICRQPGTNFGWPIYEGNEYTIPLSGQGGTTYKDLNVANQDEPNPLYGTGGCTQQYFYFNQLLKQANIDEDKTIYNPCNGSVVLGSGNRYYHKRPALEWSHAHPWTRVGIFNGTTPGVAMIGSPESGVIGTPFPGQCSVGGTLYTGNSFPAEYNNTYFQADFGNGWIKRITLDNANQITRVDNFASGYTEIVCIAQNPIDGSLVTVQLNSSTGVKKVQYGGNQPPVSKPIANVKYGPSPLTVNFNGSSSYDPTPGGSIVSYSWNFGGGSPATSTVANPGNIVFTEASGNPRKFVVRLTVTDNGGATHTDSVIISVNNTPPVVDITSPIDNSYYNPGPDTVYTCTATVSDAQHSGSQLTYEWQTTLRHNDHEHRNPIDNAVNTNTLIQRVGFIGSDVFYWLVELTVTDAAGLSTKDSVKIFPNTGAGDITPPVVSTVAPANGATNVSMSVNVVANFSEDIDAATVTGTTFQLKDAGNNLIPATVSATGNQITLDPSSNLAGSAVYTATITGGVSGVKDLAGNPLENNYSWSFTTAAADNTPPTVTSVSPVNGATGISTGANIIANFSEAVNASTVTTTTFQLRDAGNNLIPATVSTSGNQIILDPTSSLSVSSAYTVTITGGASGVKDLAGNALASNYSWSFTTGTVQPVSIQSFDTKTGTAATVHSLTGVPAGALLVLATTADAAPSNSVVSSSPALTWTKRADASAANSDNAEIWTAVYTAGGAISVTSNWGAGNSQASVCYMVLNAEAALGGASAIGTLQSAPSVAITTTRDNSIIFGCTADWRAINGATRTLRDAATERLYFRDGNYTTYHYTKAATTIGSYTEGVSAPTGQQASTALLEIRGVDAGPDITPPTVSSVSPVNGAVGVPVITTVTAIFSEAMNAATVSGTTVELRNASNVLITATVSYNAATRTVTLTPSSALANSSVHTATIKSGTSGVKDVAGNPLASDYTWSFTTEAGDITAPTVSSVSPVSGATGVSTGSNIIANFSEAVNASTVTTTTFQLRDAGNNLIPATVSTTGNQITLDPTSTLAGSAVYTATITGGASGVKDLAGNALASNYSWSFTTAAVDNTAPTVTSVSPLNGATGVSTTANIIASFSEAVNASTVTTTTFQLRDAGNNLIPAAVSTSGSQITLDPTSSLTGSTVYTATITGGVSGVKDLAGNALASNYSWSFTTGAVTVQPVTIQSFDTKTGTAATVHSLTGVPAGALLVVATTADAAPSNSVVSSSPALTWTKRADASAANSDNAEIWTAVYTAGGAITVTSNWGSGNSQASVCYVVLNAEPTLAGASAIGTLQSAPSVAITTTRDNSIIFGCTADWRAINGATRTLRDAATERLYFRDGNYTTYHYTKAAATIGSYTEGVSAPTGQQASTALLEIRGAVSGPDITPPTVSSVTPISGATNVPTNTTVSAIFSEPMDAATINSSTIELRNSSGVQMTATVLYNAGTRTATLTPSSALANSTLYIATIKGGASGVKDAAGNALASDYTWSFVTVAADATPPTVTSVTPGNGTTGVSTTGNIIANFSEAVNASTVTTTTFQLRDAGNNLIAATVSTSGNQITLDPSAALAGSTVYTATITGGASGVKDLEGNALASNFSWSFTTGAVTVQPVTIQSFDTKTGAAATTHSLTGVPAGALLVLATTADAVPTNCAVSSTPALTWTKRADASAANSDNAEIWTAVYTAGGAISVTSNWGAGNSQTSVCYVVLNAEATLGGVSAIGTLQSAPSVTITTTRDNSIIFGCTADWRAINGATRTLRDAATERLYYRDGNYTTYHYTKAAATIGSYTEGVSAPTGQQASTALVEIRGTAAMTRPAITRINNPIPVVYSYSLGQNYPNPFDKETNIPFTLSGTENVNLVLYDINGRIVKVLVNASKDAGKHVVSFNARLLAKGIYYYKIQAGDFTDIKKLTIW